MGHPIRFLLNDREVELDVAAGMAALDVVRDMTGLKGTKHACREGCPTLLRGVPPADFPRRTPSRALVGGGRI